MKRVLVATRNADKLREIREILDLPDVELIDLVAAGVEESPAEDQVESHDTFAKNAAAKGRYFCARTGMLTLADDSGLCVDALDGAPGVRSKRFSGRQGLHGKELDQANNDLLVRSLSGTAGDARTARYVCAVAVVTPEGSEQVFEATCEGVILDAPRGGEGFGYDPLFYLPGEDATFGELDRERKNRISHRAKAVRAASAMLRGARSGLRIVGAGRAEKRLAGD